LNFIGAKSLDDFDFHSIDPIENPVSSNSDFWNFRVVIWPVLADGAGW